VNVLAVLVAPTAIEPNPALDGPSVTCAIPVPDSDAVCVPLIGAFVVTVREPGGRAPTEGAVRVIVIVQLELAGSVPELGHEPPDTA
jgi:hypothetical protein